MCRTHSTASPDSLLPGLCFCFLVNLSHCINVTSAYSCVACVHCGVTSKRLGNIKERERGSGKQIKRGMKRKEKGGEGSVICRKESTCLWRVSVKDFQVWQKHFSLTVIARGHLWCTHGTDRGDFCVKREMLRFLVDYSRNVCMLCVASLINGWIGKLGKWLISVVQ